jgi:hypothetical protein
LAGFAPRPHGPSLILCACPDFQYFLQIFAVAGPHFLHCTQSSLFPGPKNLKHDEKWQKIRISTKK